LPTRGQAQGLSMQGVTLVNSDGKRFIVKGVNLEFYRDRGCSYVTAGQYPARFDTAKKFKDLGINAVRMNYKTNWLSEGDNLEKFLDIMDVFAQHGIYSMPSDHTYTGKSLAGSENSYEMFERIIRGMRSRNIESYLIMNPFNEPYNSANWPEWKSENKKVLTYLRTTANYRGVVVLDNPSWSGAFNNDYSSYRELQRHDTFLLNGQPNLIFSNHWYPNISISSPRNQSARSGDIPTLIGELGQINPGSSGLNPQYVRDVLDDVVLNGIPRGHNGVFSWIWNWCDANTMTTSWNDYVNLNQHGQLHMDHYHSKVSSLTTTPVAKPTPSPVITQAPIKTDTPTPTPTPIILPTAIPTTTPTTKVTIPNPPQWFSQIPNNLRNYLEDLYFSVCISKTNTSLAYLLEGIATCIDSLSTPPTNTHTQTSVASPSSSEKYPRIFKTSNPLIQVEERIARNGNIVYFTALVSPTVNNRGVLWYVNGKWAAEDFTAPYTFGTERNGYSLPSGTNTIRVVVYTDNKRSNYIEGSFRYPPQ